MQVNLIMFRPDGDKRVFALPRATTVLGRREDCDLRIPLSDVSRKHCRIVIQPPAVRLEDLGSSNGTFCNGVRVQEAELEPGDTVTIGPVTFVVQLDGEPAEDAIIPPTAAAAGAQPSDDSLGGPMDLGDDTHAGDRRQSA